MASAQTGGATLQTNDPRITVYRVVDPTELAHLRTAGDYGSNPSLSGKYFALTRTGARSFANAAMNAGSTITATTLPRSVVAQGFAFNDPGRYGAGQSIFFDQVRPRSLYPAMTPPVVI
jgi:hypothetical protein